MTVTKKKGLAAVLLALVLPPTPVMAICWPERSPWLGLVMTIGLTELPVALVMTFGWAIQAPAVPLAAVFVVPLSEKRSASRRVMKKVLLAPVVPVMVTFWPSLSPWPGLVMIIGVAAVPAVTRVIRPVWTTGAATSPPAAAAWLT